MPKQFLFPEEKLIDFFNRANKCVSRSKRNSQKLGNLANYEEIAESLLEKVKSAEVHFFGSRMMAIANHYSDLDIFVEVNNSFYHGLDQKVREQKIMSLVVRLSKDSNWKFKICHLTAAVPVIRCFYIPLMKKCE